MSITILLENDMGNKRLLDTFCGAGGCTKGYQQAGFYVVGVDSEPQKNYCDDEFYQADALDFIREHGHEFDVIHASPPCQAYSAMQNIHKNQEKHPDLVGPVRELLLGRPYVIENVVGAPLLNPVMLCGTMFGLPISRHRLFETSTAILMSPASCHHVNLFDPWHGTVTRRNERVRLAQAMGIDWFMTRTEVRNAIPPAYTEWIGERMMLGLIAGK